MLYFAVFRERLARDHEVLELPAGATAAVAIDALAAAHAPIRALAGTFRVAVNQSFVGDPASCALADGDELALIPPVAGGGDVLARHVLLSSEPLSADRCIAAVRDPELGGIAVFIGTVRLHNHGAAIERLDYEAYAPMAVRVMTELCAEIERELAGARIAVEHRVGSLAVGDLAVVIAAAAPHRAEAFAACRAMIDRLKASAPIWKKEFGSAGESWIGLGP